MPDRERPGPRDWAGRSAYALSLGLAVGWGGALLMAVFPHVPVSDTVANLLATLGGAIAGAVATYLGSAIHARAGSSRASDPHPPEPAAAAGAAGATGSEPARQRGAAATGSGQGPPLLGSPP